MRTSRLDDIEMRVSQHNQATFKGYTTKRRPVVLAYAVHFENILKPTTSSSASRAGRGRRGCPDPGEYDALPELARRRQPFRRALEPPSSFETPATRAPQDEGSRGG
jgi:putative endonuclease